MMPPQPYPGMYYQPMTPEHLLTKRNVWAFNAIGLLVIWIGFLIRLASSDLNAIAASRFLVFTGGIFVALVSTAGGLGSKKTSDMQNLGLLLFAGFVLLMVSQALLGFL